MQTTQGNADILANVLTTTTTVETHQVGVHQQLTTVVNTLGEVHSVMTEMKKELVNLLKITTGTRDMKSMVSADPTNLLLV